MRSAFRSEMPWKRTTPQCPRSEHAGSQWSCCSPPADIDRTVRTDVKEAGFEVVAIKGTEAPSLPAICETPFGDIHNIFHDVAGSDCDVVPAGRHRPARGCPARRVGTRDLQARRCLQCRGLLADAARSEDRRIVASDAFWPISGLSCRPTRKEKEDNSRRNADCGHPSEGRGCGSQQSCGGG